MTTSLPSFIVTLLFQGERRVLLLQIFDERRNPQHEYDDDKYPYQSHGAHRVYDVCHQVNLLCLAATKLRYFSWIRLLDDVAEFARRLTTTDACLYSSLS